MILNEKFLPLKKNLRRTVGAKNPSPPYVDFGTLTCGRNIKECHLARAGNVFPGRATENLQQVYGCPGPFNT